MGFCVKEFRQEEEIFRELSELCTSPGYIHAIAFLCLSNDFIFLDDKSSFDNFSRLYSSERLIRIEISTLIGLMLKKEIDYTIPDDGILEGYVENTYRILKDLHRSMIVHEENISFSREAIFYSAESVYDFQYMDFFIKKYKNDNEWFIKNKNFEIENIKTLINCILNIQNQKILILTESFLDAFTFTIHELIELTGFSRELILNILKEFTVNTQNEQFKTVFDYNIINARPLIKRIDDSYILFQRYTLLESAYESPFFWFKECDEDYFNKTSSKNRGNFTENFSYETLSSVFGIKNVFKNVDIFNNKTKLGEIDVLVIFLNRAIVLQAKSKKLRLESRKGNQKLLEEDFKKAIQDSYDQGFNCAKLIQEKKFKLIDASKNEIIRNEFKEIYIFCVISDHYPDLSFQVQKLINLKDKNEDKKIKPPFVMDIFLLDIMSKFLSNPLYFLSYINKRTNYFREFISSSEYSILSYHLTSNLHLSDEFSLAVIENDVSFDLDFALMVREKGIPGSDLPEGILTKYKGTIVGNFIDQIKKCEDSKWLEVGFFLLTLSEDSVFAINDGIQKMIDLFNIDGKGHDLTLGFSEASSGITIHATTLPYEEAYFKLLDHCERRKYKQKAKSWFGLCFNPVKHLISFVISLDSNWVYSEEMGFKIVKRMLENKIKIARNEKCPCGSEKKYKKCCARRVMNIYHPGVDS